MYSTKEAETVIQFQGDKFRNIVYTDYWVREDDHMNCITVYPDGTVEVYDNLTEEDAQENINDCLNDDRYVQVA